MTAPVQAPTATAPPAEPMVDPRRAFLLIAATHYELVERGELPLWSAFNIVCSWFDFYFPAIDEHCETCGLAPCDLPNFCEACRRADAPGGQA